MGTGNRRVWNTRYMGVGEWGWGTARGYRETMRNRERRKCGNPGLEEVGGWGGSAGVGESGRGGGGVGNCG